MNEEYEEEEYEAIFEERAVVSESLPRVVRDFQKSAVEVSLLIGCILHIAVMIEDASSSL